MTTKLYAGVLRDPFGNEIIMHQLDSGMLLTLREPAGDTAFGLLSDGVLVCQGDNIDLHGDGFWLPYRVIKEATKFSRVMIYSCAVYDIPRDVILAEGYHPTTGNGNGYGFKIAMSYRALARYCIEGTPPEDKTGAYKTAHIEAYFLQHGYPQHPVQIEPGVRVPDVERFVRTSLRMLEGNDGSPAYDTTFRHLNSLFQKLLQDETSNTGQLPVDQGKDVQ